MCLFISRSVAACVDLMEKDIRFTKVFYYFNLKQMPIFLNENVTVGFKY